MRDTILARERRRGRRRGRDWCARVRDVLFERPSSRLGGGVVVADACETFECARVEWCFFGVHRSRRILRAVALFRARRRRARGVRH